MEVVPMGVAPMEIDKPKIIDNTWVEIANVLFYGVINKINYESPNTYYNDISAPTLKEWENMIITGKRESPFNSSKFEWMNKYIAEQLLIYNGFNIENLNLIVPWDGQDALLTRKTKSPMTGTIVKRGTGTIDRKPSTSSVSSTRELLMSVSPMNSSRVKRFKTPLPRVISVSTTDPQRPTRRSRTPDILLSPTRRVRSRSMSPNISQTSPRILLSRSPSRSPSNPPFSPLAYMEL